MRWMLRAALVLVTGLALGCGADKGAIMPDRPMTDEEKQKVKEEDRKTAEEESGGTAGKAKPKKR